MEKIIIVFSDSHGSSFNMSEIVSRYPNAECVIHLGDGVEEAYGLKLSPVTGLLCVMGNCDLFSREPTFNRVNICGLDIIMCHGDAYGVKFGVGRYESFAASTGCDIALFGHTHVPYENRITTEKGILTVLNPGSISRPVFGKPSYALIRVTDKGYTVQMRTV